MFLEQSFWVTPIPEYDQSKHQRMHGMAGMANKSTCIFSDLRDRRSSLFTAGGGGGGRILGRSGCN